ncbi:MAG: hypothetical protein M1372_00375 [Patescibacteria group bacterium]|nr:hypothetical protein [Patescibacteria group bacterium]
MSKEHVVPIAEVQTQRINARNLHLPPYLSGRIGIDLEKTTRLMNIGGIGQVLLESKEEDDRPVPQVVGFDAQGTAYSGQAKLRTQKISETQAYELKPADSKGQEWRDLRITLDTQLIAQNIMHKKGGVASVNNWVKPLNREIRDTIRREGMLFSLTPSRFVADYEEDAMAFIAGGVGISFALLQQYEASAAAGIFVLIAQHGKLGKMFTPGYRIDALYSIHIGRAFWTAFRANTAYRNLVVAMEK